MPTLEVTVVRANRLAKKDIFGASDPYVKLMVKSQVARRQLAQTKVIKRSLNPVWNQSFKFHNVTRDHTLELQVYDANRITKDDFLGQLVLPLTHEHVGRADAPVCKHALRPRSERSHVRGTIELRLQFVDDDGQDSGSGAASFEDLSWARDGVSSSDSSPAGSRRCVVVEPTDTASVDGAADGAASAEEAEDNDNEQGSGPLPQGWEARRDANGRRYYVDHRNRRTQWQRPTQQATLPAGWSERVDPNGRVYYVDHVNRRTQWERPTAAAEGADADGAAASVSAAAAAVAGAEGDAASSAEVAAAAQRFRERRLISQEDATERMTLDDSVVEGPSAGEASTPPQPRHHRAGTVSSGEETRVTNIEDLALPSGWQAAVAPNGRKFFINHTDKTTTWKDPREERFRQLLAKANARARGAGRSTAGTSVNLLDDLGPLPPGWEERVHTDNRVFYINHNLRYTQWEDPRLELKLGGPAVPYSRDYKQKYEYFRSLLKTPRDLPNKFDIRVRRDTILEDSYRCVMAVRRPDVLKARIWVDFSDGGKGLDYGGLTREWFFLLSRELFNPYYALFEYSAADNYTLQINPQSGFANPDHLKYFQFIGRVAAMAIWHGKLLDGFFIRPFYKMMLGKKIALKDMESVDAMYFNSLQFIVDNDVEELGLEDQTFSVNEEAFGQMVQIDLIPDGRNCPITNENKDLYVEKVINWRFVDRVKEQMDAFMKGFSELIDPKHIQIFDAAELELLMCGLQDIDVKDWKQNTVFKGDYEQNHPVIVNFWRAVYSFDNETRARLLQFVTGTSRVPMNGFAELWGSNGPQKFTIERWGSEDMLPRAHTCFNRIDLPPYTTYSDLRAKLLLAIENSEGFDGVD